MSPRTGCGCGSSPGCARWTSGTRRTTPTGCASWRRPPLTAEARRRTAEATRKARTRTHLQAYAKLTRATPQGRRIAADPPLVTPLRDLLDGASAEEKGLRAVLDGYTRSLESDRRHLLSRYRLVDVARKVVGVGSVGTRCWIVLMLGRDDDDPLLLQAKEAQESVLAPYTDGVEPDHQGLSGSWRASG